MWYVILGIIVIYFISSWRVNQTKANQAEIPAEKIEDGYLWTNHGDLYDNESWIITDFVVPTYYLKMRQHPYNEGCYIAIEDEPADDPDSHTECNGERSVITEIEFLQLDYPDAKIDKRYEEILNLREEKIRKMKKLKQGFHGFS